MTDNINTQNTNTQPNNADPAVNGDQGGKMFTQEEVNNIVEKRLKRDREKREETQTASEKEKALNDRENRLSCREYIAEKGYRMELLDILSTADVNQFRESADKIYELYGFDHKMSEKRARFAAPKNTHNPPTNNLIRDAFLSK